MIESPIRPQEYNEFGPGQFDLSLAAGQLATKDISLTTIRGGDEITPECDTKVICPYSDFCSSEGDNDCSNDGTQQQEDLVA